MLFRNEQIDRDFEQQREQKRQEAELDRMIAEVHQEFIDEGFVEELPGGYIQLTEKGRKEQARVLGNPDTQELLGAMEAVRKASKRKKRRRR